MDRRLRAATAAVAAAVSGKPADVRRSRLEGPAGVGDPSDSAPASAVRRSYSALGLDEPAGMGWIEPIGLAEAE